MDRLLRTFGLAAAVAALPLAGGGCVGYRLGSSLPPGVRTIAVPTLVNETDEPLIETECTRQVLAALIRDGSLRVVPEDEADVILRGTLTRHLLTPVAFDAERTTVAEEYRMTLFASLEVVRRETGEHAAPPARVTGRTDFLLTGDLTSAKRAALPRAAEDLARNMVDQVVRAWPVGPGE